MRLLLLCAALLLGLAVSVQDAAAQGDAADAAHQALAEELLLLTGTDTAMAAATETMLDAQIQQNPQMAPYRDIFVDFFTEYVSWEALQGEIIALYAARFSPEELRAAIAFYETPTGQRFAQEMPALMQEGMMIGQQRAQQYQPKLMERIVEREQQLRDGAAPSLPTDEAPSSDTPSTEDDGAPGE